MTLFTNVYVQMVAYDGNSQATIRSRNDTGLENSYTFHFYNMVKGIVISIIH